MAPKRKTRTVLSLSRTRQMLSPLVQKVSRDPGFEVPIAVRGEIHAYLVSSRRYADLARAERALAKAAPRAKIKGTVRITRDLESGSKQAAEEFELWAGKSTARKKKR